jgi:hypothetical protein
MTGVGALWLAMGSSPERGKKEGRGGAARGRHGEGLQALLPARAASCT